MEEWDLVKLYSRAMKSKHYLEAMCFGYQMLEYIFVVLLTNSTVGDGAVPLSKTKVRKADYLLKKAQLALDNKFIDQTIYDDVAEFNRIRRDAIHNFVKKVTDYSEIEHCAKMIGPIYGKIQSQFLTITVSEEKTTSTT